MKQTINKLLVYIQLAALFSFVVPVMATQLNQEQEVLRRGQFGYASSFPADCKKISKQLKCINKTVTNTNNTVNEILDTITGTPTIKAPKLTFILITEDTPYNIIPYLKPYLTNGLGTLINNGINYTNARYAEANPSTGPSHAAMSTGALAQIHGIVNNNWFVRGVQQFLASDYTALSGRSLLYVANTSNGNQPGQTYPPSLNQSFGNGFSNRNLLADTLADQVSFYSTPQSRKQYYHVALANLASSQSYLTAGQLGKAFAFDTISGGFSSTQAFYPSAIITISDQPMGPGVGARADAWVVNGVITKIVVQNGGTGYINPVVTITNPTFGPTGAPVPPTTPATTSVTLGAGGVISAINVLTGGAGYVGGLPDWVVNWNNAQRFDLKTSWVHNLAYPTSFPGYNLPNILNYSAAGAPSIINPITGLGIPQPINQLGIGQPINRSQGSGATALATETGGVVNSPLTLTNGGSGYFNGATVAITGITSKGSLATAVANFNGPNGAHFNGSITGSTLTVLAAPPVLGTIAIGQTIFGNNNIPVGTTITGGVFPIFTLSNPVTATLTNVALKSTLNGTITSLTLTNGGTGYTNPVVNIVGGNQGNSLAVPNSNPFNNYILSPEALNKLFDFLTVLLDNNLGSTDELVIYVNCGVNLTAETYGIQALDSIDLWYQLDIAFGNFISEVYKRLDPADVLFGWISDEGADSCLKYWNQAGYAGAVSVADAPVRAALNAAILAATTAAGTPVANAVAGGATGQIFMGPIYFTQTPAIQALILKTAQSTLQGMTGVNKAYITDQVVTAFANANPPFPGTDQAFITAPLLGVPFQPIEESIFAKYDAAPERSPQIMYTTQPLFSIGFATGNNRTTWEPHNHVPLILYQKDQLENKTIVEPVYIQQLPITLAEMLGVPRPSGAPRVWGPLPGIFTNSVN